MDIEKDFVNEKELEEYKIGDRVFQLRYLLGPEVDDIDSKSQKWITEAGETKFIIDQKIRNREYLKKCVEHAPYDGSIIGKNDAEDKGIPWTQLSENDRLAILDRLKASLRNSLIEKTLMMNRANSEELKN